MKKIISHAEKRAGIDPATERLICTALIVSERACRELSTIYKPELMVAEYTKWVADKSVKFFAKHGSPVNKHIQDLLAVEQRRKKMDRALLSIIREFLTGISSEYEREENFNAGYVIDQAQRYFRARSLRLMSEDISALIENDEVEKAEERSSQYRRIECQIEEGKNPFSDMELIQRAFEQASKPLFHLPGVAGQLTDVQWKRQNFVSLMGVVGKGKTFMLQELAKRAASARNNTVFVGVGDMSEEEYALRWAVGLTGRSEDPEDCQPGWFPCVDCLLNQNGECTLSLRENKIALPTDMVGIEKKGVEYCEDIPSRYRPCSACSHEIGFQGTPFVQYRKARKVLTWQEAYRTTRRFAKRMKGRRFKLVTKPARSLTPQQLEGLLERWRDFEQFVPDVLVIDYMDELGSEATYESFRHNENEKWSAVRAIAQRWNILIITAEQSDAAGYTKDSLGMANFNEDRRRNDLVTGKMTLNRTTAEEEIGVARIAWEKLRKGKWKRSQQVVLMQDLSIARPLLGSWWRRWEKKKEEEK